MFKDRVEAGIELAKTLKPLLLEKPLILGIPRGGAVVGGHVAAQ